MSAFCFFLCFVSIGLFIHPEMPCGRSHWCWWAFMPFVVNFQILFLIKRSQTLILSLQFPLKLLYILWYAFISQSPFSCKVSWASGFHRYVFSFSCPFSWRKCGNRLSLLLIRTYGTSHLPHMGPVLKLERGAVRGHWKARTSVLSPHNLFEKSDLVKVYFLCPGNEKRNRNSCGEKIYLF